MTATAHWASALLLWSSFWFPAGSVRVRHGTHSKVSAGTDLAFGRPGLPQGTGECIGGLRDMCASGQAGEMDYPVGLSKTFIEESCYDAQCRMCTDVAWTCELSFKSGSFLESYNQNPAYSEGFCRQYLAEACESTSKAKCCTGLREWVEDGLFPPGAGSLLQPAGPQALFPLPYCRMFDRHAPPPSDGSTPPACQVCLDSIDVRFRISPERCHEAFDPPTFFAPPALEDSTGEGMLKSPTQQCLKLATELGTIAAELTGTSAQDFCACLGCCAPTDKAKPLCPYQLPPPTT